jgi:hypothetical protein
MRARQSDHFDGGLRVVLQADAAMDVVRETWVHVARCGLLLNRRNKTSLLLYLEQAQILRNHIR